MGDRRRVVRRCHGSSPPGAGQWRTSMHGKAPARQRTHRSSPILRRCRFGELRRNQRRQQGGSPCFPRLDRSTSRRHRRDSEVPPSYPIALSDPLVRLPPRGVRPYWAGPGRATALLPRRRRFYLVWESGQAPTLVLVESQDGEQSVSRTDRAAGQHPPVILRRPSPGSGSPRSPMPARLLLSEARVTRLGRRLRPKANPMATLRAGRWERQTSTR